MSSPPNPISEPVVPPVPETRMDGLPEIAPVAPPVEDPPWSGWDVLALAALTLVTIGVCVLLAGYVVHSYFLPDRNWARAATSPEAIVGGQLLAYLLILVLMYMIVESRSGGPVLQALRWNWPPNWSTYVFAGIGLELCLLPFAVLLPMPKHLPLDEFFKTARDAYILSVFGILFAPLFEELLFRGFLYPVLGAPLRDARLDRVDRDRFRSHSRFAAEVQLGTRTGDLFGWPRAYDCAGCQEIRGLHRANAHGLQCHDFRGRLHRHGWLPSHGKIQPVALHCS